MTFKAGSTNPCGGSEEGILGWATGQRGHKTAPKVTVISYSLMRVVVTQVYSFIQTHQTLKTKVVHFSARIFNFNRKVHCRNCR